MRTEFRVLSPLDRLSLATELIVSGIQHDFPVVDGGRLVGVLTRSDVERGLSANEVNASVESVMHRRAQTAHPSDMLDAVLARLQPPGSAPIVVLKNDAVVGILTVENITAFVALRDIRRASFARVHPHA